MQKQLLFSILLPLSIILFIMSYFNISSFEAIVKTNTKLKTNCEILEIKDKLRSSDLIDFLLHSDKKNIDLFFVAYPQIIKVEIYSNGKIIYTYKHHQKYISDENLNISFETHVSSKQIFYIYTEKEPKSMLSRINIFINIVSIVIFLLLSYLAIKTWFFNAVKRPLNQINSAQNRLANGEFDVRMQTELAKSGEIMQITGSFNNMVSELENFKKELEEKNQSLEDINEKYKKLNEELEVEVSKKTKELREFFSLITHDLKVPLAAVQGYTSLLMRPKTGELNERQTMFIKNIAIVNSHLTNLVRNLIDSFKYESGKTVYFFENFKLSELSGEIETNVNLFLEEKNITLTSNFKEKDFVVYGDKMKILRVIINLLSNAIKSSEENSKIELTCKELKKKKKISISITDHGKGIEEDKIKEIFKKFAQFPYNDKSSEGTGLGLYIVKKIIEDHKSEIEVTSDKNTGTSFTFYLKKCQE